MNRRALLCLGTKTLSAALPLAMLATSCTTARGVADNDVRAAFCTLFEEMKGSYPELRAWAIAHKEMFEDDLWSAMVKFDRSSAEIGAVLEAACHSPAPAERWAEAASIVVKVAQVGLRVGQFAVQAGLI